MLPALRLPVSWNETLEAARPAFRAPGFRMFKILATGLIAQTGRKSVVGILAGSGLATAISFQSACRFFSEGAWNVDPLGLCVARLIIATFLPGDAPIEVVIDDTLVKRCGKKVWAALWSHDGSAKTKGATARGNRWIVLGIVVHPSFLPIPLCLPVLFRLWLGKNTPSHVLLAGEAIAVLQKAFPDREVHAVGDAAYHGEALLVGATYTTRLPRTAVLHGYAPPPTGKRGRPRTKGERLGTAAEAAGDHALRWRRAKVRRYGQIVEIAYAEREALWYGSFGKAKGRLILVRDTATPDGPIELALFTTDLAATPVNIIERYAARWSIEPANSIGKQLIGVGDARNRLAYAVRRTVPFNFLIQSLVICWYAAHGRHPDDVAERRNLQPWMREKRDPSFEDMLDKLRRVLTYAGFSAISAGQGSPTQIHAYRLACNLALP